MTDFDEKLTQALQTLGDGVEHLTEHDPLRMQLADTLRLLVPQDGGHMLILEEWDHPAALRSQITEWLAGSLEEGRESLPKHRRVFPGEGRMLYVLADHLLDDYWRITVLGVRFIDSMSDVVPTGRRPAMAIVRIEGSGNRLTGRGSDPALPA